MGRPDRVEAPGAIYHVTARGNNKQTIYFDDRDRDLFSLMLGRSARKHRWIVFAHCLMTNHYHLVLQIEREGFSAGFRELNSGYSRRTNRRYDRTGHLFHNRFAAALLKTDAHLLNACRYVVLNPVRAGMCERPEHWRWSSYRACAGLDLPPPFLAVGELLALFGSSPERARSEFCAFVAAGQGPVSGTVTEV
jgi:putative transposase